MAFENIEKGSLTEALDDSYYQPNTIKLKPESRERYQQNLAKISVNIRNTQHKKIIVGETQNALLHFDIPNEVIDGGQKPINLIDKMVNIVSKKHDRYVENEREILNNSISTVEIPEEPEIKYDEKPIDSFELETEENEDTMELPFTTIEKEEDLIVPEIEIENEINFSTVDNSSAYNNEVNIESPSSPSEIEENLDSLSNDIANFTNLVDLETQVSNELASAKTRLSDSSVKLNQLKEEENEEIIRKYQLEKAVEKETRRQREILKKQTERINTNIFELNKEKANVDIEQEQVQTQIESTSYNLGEIKQKNAELINIINAINGSYNYDNEPEELAGKSKAA